MAQRAQVVDITKSFLPGDPNAYVQSLVNTDREDGEEKTLPLMPYEGYNFLPTAYGYKSFFGTNEALNIAALASRAQFVLLYQLPTFESRLIALCEDGIWTADANTADATWTQQVVHSYDPDVFEEWTWCVIENVLYMYKQGGSYVYKSTLDTLVIVQDALQPPSGYQTFVMSEGVSPGYFQEGYTYSIYLGYKETAGNRYSPSYELLGTFTPSIGSGSVELTITVTGDIPDPALEYAIYIDDPYYGIWQAATFASAPITVMGVGTPVQKFDILTYSAFTLSDTSTGDGTFDAAAWEVYVQYTGVSIAYAERQLLGTTTPAASVDITVDNPYVIPESGNFRMILRQVGNTAYWYKDFAAASTYVATSLTGFTEATIGTLPDVFPLPDITYPNELVIASFTPSFLNMAGQMGIFRAGLRLGFWDSSNSVSWSSNLDLTDFTPAVETMAGNMIFGFVVGRIVTIKNHGEGFVIYSTKSIVGAVFTNTGNLLWDSKKISDSTGIGHSRAVATGKNDAEHFVFSSNGIMTVGSYNALSGVYASESILTELYDILRESRDPVYLTLLQDRYLCFSVVPDDYITGKLSFSTGVANPYYTVIDWYTPSDAPSTGTEVILPEQLWEIIIQELGGKRRDQREGKWIPLYDVNYNRMDTRYYAHWYEAYPGTIDGLLSYFVRDPFIDTIEDNLTSGEISTYLDPAISSGRRGSVVTLNDVRAFFGSFDNEIADRPYRNVQVAIFNQRGEWDYFQRHQTTNVTYLRLITHISESLSEEYALGAAPALDPVSTVDTVIGTFITGEGNNEWITTHGPAEDAAIEVILRRTFTKAWRVTKRQVTVAEYIDTGVGAEYLAAEIYSTISDETGDYLGLVPPYTAEGSYVNTARRASDNAVVAVGSGLMLGPSIWGLSTPIIQYTNVTSGNPFSPVNPAPGYPDDGYAYKYTGLYTSYPEAGVGGMQYTGSSWSRLFYDTVQIRTTVTTTYIVEEITGEYGYSEMRATVVQWDRIKPGLYENYEILESVPASAMTPEVWADLYPTDRGSSRNFIESYSLYRAVTAVKLTEGTIAGVSVNPIDADGTEIPTITGYETEGITSLHTSFTLPGANFLLQTGSLSPAYPSFTGALVFDIQLKKWGKYKGDHKLLVELVPANSSVQGTLTYSDLGANAGVFSASGTLTIFDSVPTDSWIRYGKLGYYRLGFTNLLEIRASMRNPSTFDIITESSMDGKSLDLTKNSYASSSDAVVAEAYLDVSARWHTIKISGNYDLTGLEVRATIAGRR